MVNFKDAPSEFGIAEHLFFMPCGFLLLVAYLNLKYITLYSASNYPTL